MAANPYEPPSAESSTQQTAFVKAGQMKPCPSCGKDVGVWPFVKAGFSYRSNQVRCNNCGSWLKCEGTAGRVFQGLQMLGLGMAGGRATVSAFMQDWTSAGLTMLAAMPILAVILICVAPFVRRESALGLLKSKANQP